MIPVEPLSENVESFSSVKTKPPNLSMSLQVKLDLIRSQERNVKIRRYRRQYCVEFNSVDSRHKDTGDLVKDNLFNDGLPRNPQYNTIPFPPIHLPPDCMFNNVRVIRCLLPHPFTYNSYCRVPQRGLIVKSLRFWTPVCNYLARHYHHDTLMNLRLISPQLNLIATHALNTISGVSTVNPDEQMKSPCMDRTQYLGSCRVLPPLPKAPVRAPRFEYRPGKTLEFIPEDNPGRTFFLFKIDRRVEVEMNRNFQRVSGKIEKVVSILEDNEYVELLNDSLGVSLEAWIFDPLYIDIEAQPDRLDEPDDVDQGYKPCQEIRHFSMFRREAAHMHFCNNVAPLEYLSKKIPPGQTCPLVSTPIVFGLFFPERELADERGTGGFLWQPSSGVPLDELDTLQGISISSREEFIEKAIDLQRWLYNLGMFVDNFCTNFAVEGDGSFHLIKWDGIRIDPSVANTDPADTDWKEHVESEMTLLRREFSRGLRI
jgi:hypothetical protein